MKMLDRVRMMITLTPMPRPFMMEVVMAMVEHIPSSCTRTGFWVKRPSLNCFFTFMC